MIIQEQELRKLLNDPDVQRAMQMRCDESGHEWENGMTSWLQIISICRWCGERK